MRSTLITRPEPEASQLATAIAQLDIKAITFPTIVIQPATDTRWQERLRTEVNSEDLLIFVSPNAVRAFHSHFGNSLLPCGGGLGWRGSIAIGKGTAAALKQAGFTNIHCSPDIANSESTLALPILQNVAGRTCWVLRGNGGRELLPDTLKKCGATVNTLTCYERHLPPTPSIDPIIAQWHQSGFDCVICTSLEGLKNLWQLLGKHQPLLQKTPITVLSQTMVTWAYAHGIATTHWLPSANNVDILNWIREQP